VSGKRTVGVGVIGLGFMGRTHLAAYRDAAAAGLPCRVVAICDRKGTAAGSMPERAGNLQVSGSGALFDPAAVRMAADSADLLQDPAVELVSICTPTDTHADLAVRALEAGKHVLVEKPLALDPAECERVERAAARSGKLCMPAFCMRFWPGWSWLKERIADGAYGAVRSAMFQRLSAPPDWSADFYRNSARTGGALCDLHIHDADFVQWCFGEPDAVASTGSVDHVTTLYRYRRGPAHVVAEGGWDHTPGFPFTMRYVVVFEHATATFDLARPTPLLVARGGALEVVELPAGTGYDGEVREIVGAIAEGRTALRATVSDATAVARLLARERAALSAPV